MAAVKAIRAMREVSLTCMEIGGHLEYIQSSMRELRAYGAYQNDESAVNNIAFAIYRAKKLAASLEQLRFILGKELPEGKK